METGLFSKVFRDPEQKRMNQAMVAVAETDEVRAAGVGPVFKEIKNAFKLLSGKEPSLKRKKGSKIKEISFGDRVFFGNNEVEGSPAERPEFIFPGLTERFPIQTKDFQIVPFYGMFPYFGLKVEGKDIAHGRIPLNISAIAEIPVHHQNLKRHSFLQALVDPGEKGLRQAGDKAQACFEECLLHCSRLPWFLPGVKDFYTTGGGAFFKAF